VVISQNILEYFSLPPTYLKHFVFNNFILKLKIKLQTPSLPGGFLVYVCALYFNSFGPALIPSAVCRKPGFKLWDVVLSFKLLQIKGK